MVQLQAVLDSNSRIATELPSGLVAVFVGATSGIGEAALKAFAKHASQPIVYFVGRSQQAADRITAECKARNADGKYIFIKADTSLIRNVDAVCQEIQRQEKAVNLLFMSTGTLVSGIETPEGLHYAASLVSYSRNRFISNLLPLIQRSSGPRRVVTVLCAGNEGPIDTDDYQGRKLPIMKQRGHGGSIVTLSLEALAQKASDVTFIHNHPGQVKTNLVRGGEAMAIRAMTRIFKVFAPLVCMSLSECGERHLYLATSAKYLPSTRQGAVNEGVALADGASVATGTDGRPGSGVYSVDPKGESTGLQVQESLARLRAEGMVKQVWDEMESQYQRILG